MNRQVLILRSILENPCVTQRELAEILGTSLGTANTLFRECLEQGLIAEEKCEAEAAGKEAAGKIRRASFGKRITEKGMAYLAPYKVERALIFAAGFGSRFVPITYEVPKGLVEVYGEPMLERQIKQLYEAGITDITVMVGYLKEKFEYLIDKFGVKLLYNPEYAEKNTLATMYHAIPVLSGKNCYILNSDNWLRHSLYHAYEGGAWYGAAYAEGDTKEWVLHFDKKTRRISETYPGGKNCWYMYGPAYFSREFSEQFLPVLRRYYEMPGTEQYYWEYVLMEMLNGQAKRRCTAYFGHLGGADAWKEIDICANCQPDGTIYEFENIEELRQFDDRYNHNSGSEAMALVSRVFEVPESEIRKIRCLKAGMTNNSWLFSVKGKDYICRIPGEGTEKLINRREEKEAYETVRPLGLTDELIYFDAETGYKISSYYEGSRTADPKNEVDLRACMAKLRVLHSSGLSVGHAFNIWERINCYEKLCREAAAAAHGNVNNRYVNGNRNENADGNEKADGNGKDANGNVNANEREKNLPQALLFQDYAEQKCRAEHIFFDIQKLGRRQSIAHIDSVADNFLFLPGAELPDGSRDFEKIKLIDWEYCGMCDPLIDVSMCAIYSFMNEAQADRLLQFYLERLPSEEETYIFYAYMALGGLLWSLWGIYKEELGVQFSDYTIKMYRYFKHYADKIKA